jgi:hypothetical protein
MEKENEKPGKKENKTNLVITQVFIAKANDWNRTFMGSFTKEKDENGNVIALHSNLIVKGCTVWAMAPTEEKMYEYNDSAAILILDFNLANMKGVKSLIAGNDFSHN